MPLCALCNEHPAGSACTASGRPGLPFNKTPAPHSPSSDNASGTHQGHAAEVTNDGGTTGFITRRESMAMASGAGGAIRPSPLIYETDFREPGRTAPEARAGGCSCSSAQPPCIADEGREVDLAAWLLTVPGIPADWPSSQPIIEGNGLALVKLAGRA